MQQVAGSEFFWSTIADAHRSRERLREILQSFSADEIVWFHEEFVSAASELKSEPYIDHMITSEDAVEVIADWVVSQGRDYYASVLRNPSAVPFDVEEDDPCILSGVAATVFRERFGKLLPSH